MKIQSVFILFFLCLGCGQSGKNSKDNRGYHDAIAFEALKFYEWYLKSIKEDGYFRPRVVRLNERLTLDTSSYLEELRNLDVLSPVFLDREKERWSPCFNTIREIQVDSLKSINVDNISTCGFEYYYWLNLQETTDGFDVVNILEKSSDAEVLLRAFWNTEDGKEYLEGFLYIVHFSKNETWQIDKIEIQESKD